MLVIELARQEIFGNVFFVLVHARNSVDDDAWFDDDGESQHEVIGSGVVSCCRLRRATTASRLGVPLYVEEARPSSGLEMFGPS